MERMREKMSTGNGAFYALRQPSICAPKICLDELSAFAGVPAASDRGSEQLFEVEETEAILLALARAVEQRDRQTAGHCERLAYTSISLGIAMGLDRSEILALYRGGFLDG